MRTRPRGLLGVTDDVSDVEAADVLQDCQKTAAKITPGSRSLPSESPQGQEPERGKNSSRLKTTRAELPRRRRSRPRLSGHVAGGDRRDDQQHLQDGQQAKTAQPPGEEVRPALERYVPDVLEGVLSRADDPRPASSRPTRRSPGAALPFSEWSCAADRDDRELAERRSKHAGFWSPRSPSQHEAEHRHQHEQQREQRDEAVVGDQRRELAGLVVAELLDHRGGEAEPRVALLDAIQRLQAVGEAHWEGGLRARAIDMVRVYPMRAGNTSAGRSPARARGCAQATRSAAGDGAGGAGQARSAAARTSSSAAQGGPGGLLQPGDARAAGAGDVEGVRSSPVHI